MIFQTILSEVIFKNSEETSILVRRDNVSNKLDVSGLIRVVRKVCFRILYRILFHLEGRPPLNSKVLGPGSDGAESP